MCETRAQREKGACPICHFNQYEKLAYPLNNSQLKKGRTNTTPDQQSRLLPCQFGYFRRSN
jgi:hypothetical protein